MYDDTFNAEKIGEYHKKPGERSGEEDPTEDSPEAKRWEDAMAEDDVPAFAGEWGYGLSEESAVEGAMAVDDEAETNAEANTVNELFSASQLTSYGLDTASRVYGANTVIKTILDIDETERDAYNPLGAIYQRLAPTPNERAYLYQEIRKEHVRNNQYNQDAAISDADDPRLGFTRKGVFYDKTGAQANGKQVSADAIRSFKNVVSMLETSERFADIRTRAAAEGKDITEYLLSGDNNPTLTDFLNQVGAAMSEDEAAEIVTEIEQENHPDSEPTDEPNHETSLGEAPDLDSASEATPDQDLFTGA